MKKIIIILTLIITSFVQAENALDKSIDLEQISLKGLDKDVKKVFKETKKLILQARKSNDKKTELTGSKSWCLLIHNYNFLEAAKECYYKVGLSDKENEKWSYLFGKAAHDNGDTQDAVKGFLETLHRDQNYLPAHIYLIQLAIQAGDLRSAFDYLSAIPVDLKLTSIALKVAGDLFFEVENYHVAIGYYQQVLKLVPAAGSLNYKIAKAYQALQQTDMAEIYLEKANSVGVLVIDPYFQEVKQQIVGEVPFLIKAKKALENKDVLQAIQLYKKALEFNPTSESALVNIAVAYYQNNQINLAIQTFEDILKSNPSQARALYNLASISFAEKKYEESLKYFVAYNKVNPSDETVVLTVAKIYYQQKRFADVLKVISGDNDIKKTEYQLLKAKSMIQLGDYSKATELLERIYQHDKNSLDVMSALAKIYFSLPDGTNKNSELALKYSKLAYEKQKDVRTLWQLILSLDKVEQCDAMKQRVTEMSEFTKEERSTIFAELIVQRGKNLKCKLKISS